MNHLCILLVENSCQFFNFYLCILTQGCICENSGAAITCRDESVVALNNCILERNGVDAIIKDERASQSKEDEVMAESAAALILVKD